MLKWVFISCWSSPLKEWGREKDIYNPTPKTSRCCSDKLSIGYSGNLPDTPTLVSKLQKTVSIGVSDNLSNIPVKSLPWAGRNALTPAKCWRLRQAKETKEMTSTRVSDTRSDILVKSVPCLGWNDPIPALC